MTVEIPLTQGKVTVIDDEDAELVLQYKWCAKRATHGLWYAIRSYRAGPRTFMVGCIG